MKAKKIFRQIHIWLSVPFGIFIALIWLSGALMVFETENTELCRPEVYHVKKVGQKPMNLSQLMVKVSATLPVSVQVTGVSVRPEADRTWQVSLSKRFKCLRKSRLQSDCSTRGTLGSDVRINRSQTFLL